MSTTTPRNDQVQGEGDYDAARRYDKASREFADSGRVEPAAHDAAPSDASEAEELERAEEEGKSHSKGEGPLVSKKRKACDGRSRVRVDAIAAALRLSACAEAEADDARARRPAARAPSWGCCTGAGIAPLVRASAAQSLSACSARCPSSPGR